ncbi:MAG TPA: GMC family oxidoreductase [Longimicrobiales bacterium]|nr:GMC family oxidoreductase [Longimicrobiales bacterium]
MQVPARREPYDVCIVGSGAGGGMAAYVLTKAGANVVMLEAGPLWYSTRDSVMMKWPYESPRRGASTHDKPFGEFDGCIGGWELDGEPYTTAPGERFLWWRGRMLGGRTNHWGRISLRFGAHDFRRRSIDGQGEDWPISYDDLKPYYDEVDRLIGVFGAPLGPAFPNEPDGIFLPPPKPRCYELMIADAGARLGIPVVPSRLSILTRPHNGRPGCHYCGQCGRGCGVNANFSSPEVLIRPALATGRLTIVPEAMAREVTIDRAGNATGVAYVDKRAGADRHVRARIVVLAASACESARLLLNSKSSLFPDGLANSSGTVGMYLTDTTGVGVSGFIPKLLDMPPHNEDGVGGMHVYTPWWLDNAKLDFPRGYHIEIGGGRRLPGYGFGGGLHRWTGGGYGAQFKADQRRHFGAMVHFEGRGEMVASERCWCEIDPNVVDRWGIPVLRFHWRWSQGELNQARHMQETFRALIRELGGQPTDEMPGRDEDYGLAAGGQIIHEVGCTRMGHDPERSVLTPNCQAHDVKNLFVADGGPFVNNADKNPTWTILALSMRTSTYIADQMQRRAL